MPLDYAVRQNLKKKKNQREDDVAVSVNPRRLCPTAPKVRRTEQWLQQTRPHLSQSDNSQSELTSHVTAEEDRLGIFLSQKDGPRKAAQAMLHALYRALTAYAHWKKVPIDSIDNLVRQAFFQDDPASAGQSGLDSVYSRFESLTSPNANTREVMTAIYNASYAKIFSHTHNPNTLSLKGIVGDFFIHSSAGINTAAHFAHSAGLNAAYLSALTDFAIEAANSKSSDGNLDIFHPPLLAQYSSAEDAEEYALAMKGRKLRSSIEHPLTSVSDIIAAGESVGDNEMNYLRSFVYAFTRTNLTTTTYTIEEALAKYDAKCLAELRKHTDVALVKENYETAENGTVAAGSIDVTSGKVQWVRVPRDSRQPQVPDNQIPIPWRTGEEYFSVAQDSAWRRDVNGNKGYPVRTGISGTTMRMLVSYGALGAPGGKPTDFLYALMAWMLPRHDHSLYEIFRGAQMLARTTAKSFPKRPSFISDCAMSESASKLTNLLSLIDTPNGLREAYPLLSSSFSEDFPGLLTPGTYSPKNR